jgi:DNA-binding transcriptional ArsR family regulator
MPVAETFKALGDPTRLEMIKRLSDGSSYTVGSLSDGLGLTRQGARKHLQVLADVDLVSLRPSGRQTEVELDIASLASAKLFISTLEQRWDQRLRDLRDFVEDNTST